jgi:hypothetical protein
MRRELFVGLDVGLYPRQSFGAGDVVLAHETMTDRLLVVLEGRLSDAAMGRTLGPGDVARPVEFFGANRYSGTLCGREAGQVAIVPRPAVRACFDAQGSMLWNLACAIAIEALAAAKELA